jgi:hypothetical protein
MCASTLGRPSIEATVMKDMRELCVFAADEADE